MVSGCRCILTASVDALRQKSGLSSDWFYLFS